MSSIEIAELTGKLHKNVIRDIREMICGLHGLDIDGSNLSHELQQYVIAIKYDYRDYIEVIELNEEHTLTLTTGYSVIQRNKLIKQWQSMRNALDTLRYRKDDKVAQIEAMALIHKFLSPKDKQRTYPFMNANKLVNKITSLLFGMNTTIHKKDMTLPMLERRTHVLNDFVKLFEMEFSYDRIKALLFEKYLHKALLREAA